MRWQFFLPVQAYSIPSFIHAWNAAMFIKHLAWTWMSYCTTAVKWWQSKWNPYCVMPIHLCLFCKESVLLLPAGHFVGAQQSEGNKEVSPWPIGLDWDRDRKFKWINRKWEVTSSKCLFVLDVFGAWLPLYPVVSCVLALFFMHVCFHVKCSTNKSVIYLSMFLINCKIHPNRIW